MKIKERHGYGYAGRTPGYVSAIIVVLFIAWVFLGVPYLVGKDLPRWSYFDDQSR